LSTPTAAATTRCPGDAVFCSWLHPIHLPTYMAFHRADHDPDLPVRRKCC